MLCARTFSLHAAMSPVGFTFTGKRRSLSHPGLRPTLTSSPFTLHCTPSTSKGLGAFLGISSAEYSRLTKCAAAEVRDLLGVDHPRVLVITVIT